MPNDPTDGGAIPESSRLDQPPAALAGSIPADVAPRPATSPAAQEDPPPPSAARSRSLRKRFWTPVCLAVLGLAFLGVGFKLLPSRSGITPLPSTGIIIQSKKPLIEVDYKVTQKSSSVYKLTVEAFLAPGKAEHAVYLTVLLPHDAHFHKPPGANETLPCSTCLLRTEYREMRAPAGISGATLSVMANVFGVTSNGINAFVAIPSLEYIGPGKPEFFIYYKIPSAGNYSWSSSPDGISLSDIVEWSRQATPNRPTQDIDAVGINYAEQQRDDHFTFLAGALIGLAGAALLSAVQEALHAND